MGGLYTFCMLAKREKKKKEKEMMEHLPLTRALAEGFGVGVPNVAMSHDVIY